MKRGRLSSPQDFIVPEGLYAEIALSAFEEINTPRALMCAILLRYGEFTQLSELSFIPDNYNCLNSARGAWTPTELLRKFSQFPGIGPDVRKARALQKAREAELRCGETNRRMAELEYGGGNPRLYALILSASAKIHALLPEYSLRKHLDRCRWGPGSDAFNKRPFIGPYHKYHNDISFTCGASPFVASMLESDPLWARWLANPFPVGGAYTPTRKIVRGNVWSTVRKNAQIDRSICVEPGANVRLQLGLGLLLRRSLLQWGIDLSDQEMNRWYALLGSESSEWCTIDLSSASDTVARRLVWILFCNSRKLRTWYYAMDALRAPFTSYGGRRGPWELNHKFSSMGNGFTFELETIVFASIVRTVAEWYGGKCAAVYGDDIIVSRDIYPQVTEALVECGFLVNPKKSFSTGYFRESCGMNAWNGYELPSYRLESLTNLAEVYSFHNGLCHLGLSRTAARLRRRIPASLRFFGPSGAGDAFLHSSDKALWNFTLRGVKDQWFFWGGEVMGLTFKSTVRPTRSYEPALLHSRDTKIPLSDHPVYTGGNQGTEGVVTLSDGEWTIGRHLLSRDYFL